MATPQPPSNVTVYTEQQYAGVRQQFVEGRYNLGELTTVPMNTISSLHVPPGTEVTLYEYADLQGRSLTLYCDTPLLAADFDDVASSLAVSSSNGAPSPRPDASTAPESKVWMPEFVRELILKHRLRNEINWDDYPWGPPDPQPSRYRPIDPQKALVITYSEPHHRGDNWEYAAGFHNNPEIALIQSMWLAPGAKVLLLGEEAWEYTTSQMDLSANRGSLMVVAEPQPTSRGQRGEGSSKSFEDFAAEVRGALEGSSAAALRSSSPIGAASSPDAQALAGALLAAVAVSAPPPSAASASKAMSVALTLSDPTLVANEAFMSDVMATVHALSPIVQQAVAQAGVPASKGSGRLEDIVAGVPVERREDKGWIDFVTGAIGVLGPPLLQAIAGQKDFSADDVPTLEIPAEHIDDKGWIEDALGFVTGVIPTVLPMLLGGL